MMREKCTMFNLLLAIVVSASIDSTMLMLGDQTAMHLQVTHEQGERVEMPVFGEMLQDGIEIVEQGKIDTTTLPDGRVQLQQELVLTSFKDSLFSIAPIAIASGEDTFWTESMALNVIQPFEVDTTLAITDIKDIEKAPIWWWGIIRWILLALGLGGLGVGVYYLWRWYEKNRKPEEEVIEPELLRPADEVALEKLDEIKAQKIWKDGKVKEYQTELTDVVREYIGRRFDVQSTEKTSDETLRELKPILVNAQFTMHNSQLPVEEGKANSQCTMYNSQLPVEEGKELYGKLSKMLRLADLVKFAKWHTTPDENEQALNTAYEFVKETKPTPDPSLKGGEEETPQS